MSIKISELPSATSVGDNDLVPIVQGGETKKALASAFGGGGGGTSDYTDLSNKPSINSVTLSGNKTSGDLNLVGTGDIATTIDSTSTNSQVAGAKAVYDLSRKTLAKLSLGLPNVDETFDITNITATYVPKDITTMRALFVDNNYCTYNTTNGRLTFLKSCKFKAYMTTQIRSSGQSSATSTTTPLLTKGFGYRIFDSSNTQTDTGSIAELTILTGFSNMYGIYESTVNVGDYLIPMAYSRTLSGTTSYNSRVWGYGRTSLEIELVEDIETAQTLNLTRGTSTGSLVGMGDRTELTSLEVADTNVGEIPSEDKAEVTVEEKTVEVEPIETLKEEKESGDTI